MNADKLAQALRAARTWLEADKWRYSTNEKHASWEALMRGIDEALAAHDSAQGDADDAVCAARYRWLRGAEAGCCESPFIGYRNAHGFSQFIGEYADKAIDAAMLAAAKEES